MEGRQTAPPEIGCSHGSSSSRAYQKDESSSSDTSSPGRRNSSNSGSTSDEGPGQCSMSRDECNSSPDAVRVVDTNEPDVNRQLLNILVTANHGDMLITDKTISNLKDYFKGGMDRENLSRLKQYITTNTVSIQTDPDPLFPPFAVVRSPAMAETADNNGNGEELSVNSSYTDIATTSEVTDGVLPLVIRNFSHMQETMRGPVMGIRGVPWRIMVMPRQHVVQKKGTQKCLGFFLQCCPTAYSDSWSCQANAELRLISQKPDVPNFTRKTSHSYTAKENDWGYSCFMTWADILDESQGYIKDNVVKVEVSVRADPPKNILDLEAFQKKVREYIRLADVQAQRGFIDKAIDVNTSATKFCKDKDSQCKTELETQLNRLIDMKLKQSIERIEKGSSSKTVDEDGTSNINALRQAIGGGLTARAQKLPKSTKTTKDVESCKKDLQMAKAHFRAQKVANRTIETKPAIRETARQTLAARAAPMARRVSTGLPPQHKAQTLVASGHFNENVCPPNKSTFRRVINGSLPEVDEISDVSGDNGSEGGEVYVGHEQIEVKVTPSEDGSETKINFTKVINSLKSISTPDLVIRKSFQNPVGMAYREGDCFIEELTHGAPSPMDVMDSSVQTESINPDLVLVTDSAVVDAASSKSLPASPDEKMRKVKRVRKTRKADDAHALAGDSKGRSEETAFAGKNDASQESDSPGTFSSMNYPESLTDNQDFNIIDYEDSMDKPRFYSAPPLGLAFQMASPVDAGEGEDDGFTDPSLAYIDLVLKQNINNLLREFSLSNLNGRTLKVGIDTSILHGFPGYNPTNPISEFEQRLVTNALNIVSVNCLNFSASITSIFKFFTSIDVAGKASKLHEALAHLSCAIQDLPAKDYEPNADPRDTFEDIEIPDSNDNDYILDKSYQRLCDFLATECRVVMNLFGNFEYAEKITEATTCIQELRKQINTLKLQDQQTRALIRQVEDKKKSELSELRKEVQAEKEKNKELTLLNRESKHNVKRLERRVKIFDGQAVDSNDYKGRYEHSQQQYNQLLTKFNELSTTNAREKQSLQDSKNNLIREKQNLDSDNKALKSTVEDLKAATRKVEQQLGNERRTSAANLKSEKDRAMKAECAQIENILELGLKILERAREDCKIQIKIIETHLSKIANPTEEEINITNKNLEEWTTKSEEIIAIIATAKAESQSVIAEIKKGKLLSTLPKFVVAKPPPHPVVHPMPSPAPPPPPPAIIAPPPPQMPIGSQRRTSPQIVVPQQNYVMPSSYRNDIPMLSPLPAKNVPRGGVTPNYNVNRGNVPMPNSYMPHGRPNSTVGIPQSPKPAVLPLPIGVRPENFGKNNGNMQQGSIVKDNIDNAAAMLSAVTSNGVSSSNVRGLNISPQNAYGNGSHDIFSMNSTRNTQSGTPWYDPLNTYNDYFSIAGNARWTLGNFGTTTTEPSTSMFENDTTTTTTSTSSAIGSRRRHWVIDADDYSTDPMTFK